MTTIDFSLKYQSQPRYTGYTKMNLCRHWLNTMFTKYTCKVTRLDDYTFQTYTGLTDNTFKKRLYGHNSDFRKRKNRNKTMLSKYIWFLKDNIVQYELNWSILGKAKSFNPVTGVCRLCLLEKYFILYNPKDATLNSRDEVFNSCRHKWKHTLSRA